MRRPEREIKDPAAIRQVLDTCKVCRIAMQDAQGLYIVPVNFAYTLQAGKLCLYLHSAKEGRKAAALRAGCAVAFEMDCSHNLLPGKSACSFGFQYQSILGNGTACEVTDDAEKCSALALIMQQQTGQTFSFSAAQTGCVAVFRIDADAYTGKQCMPQPAAE